MRYGRNGLQRGKFSDTIGRTDKKENGFALRQTHEKAVVTENSAPNSVVGSEIERAYFFVLSLVSPFFFVLSFFVHDMHARRIIKFRFATLSAAELREGKTMG